MELGVRKLKKFRHRGSFDEMMKDMVMYGRRRQGDRAEILCIEAT